MRLECLGCGATVNGGTDVYLVLKGYQSGTKFIAEAPDGYLCSACREDAENLGGAIYSEELEKLLPSSEQEGGEKQQGLKSRIVKLLERLKELEASKRSSEFPIKIPV